VFSFSPLDLRSNLNTFSTIWIPQSSDTCAVTIYTTQGLDTEEYNALLDGDMEKGIFPNKVIAKFTQAELLQVFAM